MTELEALRLAASGRGDFTTDLVLTKLGHAGMWQLERAGTEQVEPYVMQGGFTVTEWPTYRSRLTGEGEKRLAELEANASL